MCEKSMFSNLERLWSNIVLKHCSPPHDLIWFSWYWASAGAYNRNTVILFFFLFIQLMVFITPTRVEFDSFIWVFSSTLNISNLQLYFLTSLGYRDFLLSVLCFKVKSIYLYSPKLQIRMPLQSVQCTKFSVLNLSEEKPFLTGGKNEVIYLYLYFCLQSFT